MVLKLYNTLTRKKEVFKPLKKNHVGIYTCGPTVYSYQHIGNLRTYISTDLIKRVLLQNNYKIKHVINVTDVGHLTSDADLGEDKIERAAKKEGKKASEISEYYFKLFKKDLEKLNILEPNYWPKATKHIGEQITLIKDLENKGYTYKTSDGIYFDSSKVKDYGKLARLDIKNLRAGKRITVGEKKNKTDFALWKFSENPGKRQQEWKSPWGIGFPGWHIECSAMSSKYLGKQFDIHTGGQDHIPVHHTNEIAQSESSFGKKPWVNYWIHFAWLLFKGEKVSKSKGGLYTISDLEKKRFSPLAFRYICLATHYRKPLNFTLKNLESAKNSLKRLKEIISRLDRLGKSNKKNIEIASKEFLNFLNDDFNSPRALSYMWEILRDNKLKDSEKYKLVLKFDEIFGLDLDKKQEIKIPTEVKKLAKDRENARKKKEWKESDNLRDKINKLGYVIEDKKRGYKIKINNGSTI